MFSIEYTMHTQSQFKTIDQRGSIFGGRPRIARPAKVSRIRKVEKEVSDLRKELHNFMKEVRGRFNQLSNQISALEPAPEPTLSPTSTQNQAFYSTPNQDNEESC